MFTGYIVYMQTSSSKEVQLVYDHCIIKCTNANLALHKCFSAIIRFTNTEDSQEFRTTLLDEFYEQLLSTWNHATSNQLLLLDDDGFTAQLRKLGYSISCLGKLLDLF